MDIKIDKKEMLHKIKEIADKQINCINDIDRIIRNANDLKADVEKIQFELEAFFNDFMKKDGEE